MKKYAHIGSIAVVVAALLWSVDGLLRRHLYALPAPVIVFWEHTLGFIILAPFLLATWRKFKELTRKQWLSIGLVALLSGALGTILYTAALGRIQYIPFSVVVLLQQLNPVFAITAAAILLRERLTRRFVLLSLAALLGAYLTAFPKGIVDLGTGSGTLIAALFAVGAAAAWGISTAFSKYSLKGTSYLHITGLRFGITPIFAFLFVLGSGNLSQLGSMTSGMWGYLLAITFSTGMVALLIYYYGLQRVPASRSAILELAWPLSSVVVGWLFLHQGLTLVQAFGAITLLVTTYLITRDTRDVQPVERKVD